VAEIFRKPLSVQLASAGRSAFPSSFSSGFSLAERGPGHKIVQFLALFVPSTSRDRRVGEDRPNLGAPLAEVRGQFPEGLWGLTALYYTAAIAVALEIKKAPGGTGAPEKLEPQQGRLDDGYSLHNPPWAGASFRESVVGGLTSLAASWAFSQNFSGRRHATSSLRIRTRRQKLYKIVH